MSTNHRYQGREYRITADAVSLVGFVPGWGKTYSAINDTLAAEVRASHAASIAARDELRAQASTGRRSYVRFGAVPESGRSYNRLDNRAEAGVSVYAAWITDSTVYIDCTGTYATVALGSESALYEVVGVELDERGGDDEPLLASARQLGELTQDWVVVK